MAERSIPTLTYLPQDGSPPSRPTLIDQPTTCRLILPPPSPWMHWLNIGYAVLLGTAKIATIIMLCRTLLLLAASFPGHVLIRTFWFTGLLLVGSAAFWFTSAAIQWTHYRRFGRIPETLDVDPTGLTWRRQRLLGLRYRYWSPAKIHGLRLRPLKSLTPRTPVSILTVCAPGFLKPRLRLAGSEPVALGHRFVARAAELLSESSPISSVAVPKLARPLATISPK